MSDRQLGRSPFWNRQLVSDLAIVAVILFFVAIAYQFLNSVWMFSR